jgi:hypothetical protein
MLDGTIKNLNSTIRYDVLINEVAWTSDVDLKDAHDAVLEIMIMAVKDEAFRGDIIVRPTYPEDRPTYNGAKCEEDGADGSSGVERHLQVVGGAGRPTEGPTRAQRQLEDQGMRGECCGHRAYQHSRVPPFICRICTFGCIGWDSGE